LCSEQLGDFAFVELVGLAKRARVGVVRVDPRTQLVPADLHFLRSGVHLRDSALASLALPKSTRQLYQKNVLFSTYERPKKISPHRAIDRVAEDNPGQ